MGYVDALGLKTSWSTAAYIKYTDEDFEELVEQQLKPTGLIMWAFLDWGDVQQLLTTLTRFTEQQIKGLNEAWTVSRSKLTLHKMPPIQTTSSFTSVESMPDLDPEVRNYLEETHKQITSGAPHSEIAKGTLGYVSIESLTNPLVYIDYELLEELKPELAGTSPLDVAKFAFPRTISTSAKAIGDPSGRSVTFVSNQKTLAVSNIRLRGTPEGTEVSYLISANASAIIVSDMKDRLLLRNGIHRAYLLAQLGITHVPCILVSDNNAIPVVMASYPVFSPAVLVQPRQPMLMDFLKPELCLQAPMQRTHRVIRVSVEDTIIPVD
jgi:hypothetical protein